MYCARRRSGTGRARLRTLRVPGNLTLISRFVSRTCSHDARRRRRVERAVDELHGTPGCCLRIDAALAKMPGLHGDERGGGGQFARSEAALHVCDSDKFGDAGVPAPLGEVAPACER